MPDWMIGMFDVSPVLVGVIVAVAVVGSLTYLFVAELRGPR